MNLFRLSAYALSALLLTPYTALAAADHLTVPDSLSAWWIIPFAGMLLSIAILPLTAHVFWEHHRGKISIFWALAFLVPCLAVYGPGVTFYEFCHIILLDYVPFLVLLFSLYTVAGGVRLKGSLTGTPPVNLGILAIGTVLASWMGTTERPCACAPLLRASAPQIPCAFCGIFHLSGGKHRRFTLAAGRPAAVSGFFEGRGLFLDNLAPVFENPEPVHSLAGDLFCSGHGAL